MAMSRFVDMAHDDEQLYELSKGMPDDWEPPEYPCGLCFMLPASVLEQVEADGGDPGDTMRFGLMAKVTSVFRSMDDCRVELRVTDFAGEDGQFVDLDDDDDMPWMAPSLCLCAADLDKLGLEADCDLGDTIHLVGTVRLESLSNDGFSGEQARLQITELTYAGDESAENREA
jgi:hypothetical protein